jgi:hypothetical protein
MSSNRVVTYIDFNLNSVEEYWGRLVVSDVQAFRREPSPSSVVHASLSVWHLHDWVWHERNPGQDSRGAAFDAYRNGLLTQCPQLGWLRDVADAGKHRGLGRLPQVAGAEPHGVYLPLQGTLLPPGPVRFFLVLNDGSLQDVEGVLRTATEFWRAELEVMKLSSPFD